MFIWLLFNKKYSVQLIKNNCTHFQLQNICTYTNTYLLKQFSHFICYSCSRRCGRCRRRFFFLSMVRLAFIVVDVFFFSNLKFNFPFTDNEILRISWMAEKICVFYYLLFLLPGGCFFSLSVCHEFRFMHKSQWTNR